MRCCRAFTARSSSPGAPTGSCASTSTTDNTCWTRTVVVATGARWRTLGADNVERFTGAGVYHAAMATDAERCRGEDVIVVGGGNSAGQAAVHLSRAARSVSVVVRGEGLASTMSRYLVERIESRANIEIVTGTEVSAVHGGSIVITSSAAGLKGNPNAAHYTAAKHGVVGLMRTLANELAADMVRVNTVHPSAVDTEQVHNQALYHLFPARSPGRHHP